MSDSTRLRLQIAAQRFAAELADILEERDGVTPGPANAPKKAPQKMKRARPLPEVEATDEEVEAVMARFARAGKGMR